MHKTRDQLTREMADARARTGRRRLSRTVADAWAVRQRRNELAASMPPEPRPLLRRLAAAITDRYGAEVMARGGETTISEANDTVGLSIRDRDKARRLVLLGAEGWRHYSNRFGARPASVNYLCGLDDNGPWAVRIPGTLSTVAEALDWITPAPVHKALAAGRRVLRQGDVYAVESRSDRPDDSELGAAHTWHPRARVLLHHPEDGRKHAPMVVPFRCRFYTQQVFRMGRGRGWGAGD